MHQLSALVITTELSLASVSFRLLVSLVIGGAIGIEREHSRQPAGFRTHIIIAVGAALLMMLSIAVAGQYGETRGDAGRIAAQVVSGIGFLGAGAILKLGADIRGLTTAASLWTVAAIGLATGAGLFLPAAVAGAIILFTLIILEKLEDRWLPKQELKHIEICTTGNSLELDDIRRILTETGIRVRSLNVDHSVKKKLTRFRYVAYVPRSLSYHRLYQRLAEFEDIYRISVGERTV